MKPEDYYYTRVFWSDEDHCYIAEVPELKGCSGFGKTEAIAIKEAKISVQNWLKVARQESIHVPKPLSQMHADRLNLRIPSDLVIQIKRRAKEAKMSLNQFVMSLLFRSV